MDYDNDETGTKAAADTATATRQRTETAGTGRDKPVDLPGSVKRILSRDGEDPGDFTSDLDAAWSAAWALIERGVNDRKSAAHSPNLVTNGLDGWPQSRTVVLRGAQSDQALVWCHSDARTPKVEEIAADNRVTMHIYDPRAKMQLRLMGRATVSHDDRAAQLAWERSRLMSRRCYLAVAPPGSPAGEPTSGLPDDLEGRAPEPEESEAGYENFAVIALAVEKVDWLFLAAAGHRRAIFTVEDGTPRGQWVVP